MLRDSSCSYNTGNFWIACSLNAKSLVLIGGRYCGHCTAYALCLRHRDAIGRPQSTWRQYRLQSEFASEYRNMQLCVPPMGFGNIFVCCIRPLAGPRIGGFLRKYYGVPVTVVLWVHDELLELAPSRKYHDVIAFGLQPCNANIRSFEDLLKHLKLHLRIQSSMYQQLWRSMKCRCRVLRNWRRFYSYGVDRHDASSER